MSSTLFSGTPTNQRLQRAGFAFLYLASVTIALTVLLAIGALNWATNQVSAANEDGGGMGRASLQAVALAHNDSPSYCSDLSFTPAPNSPFPVGTSPVSVTGGHFNSDQDSYPDLAIVNHGSNNVTILLGTGTGGFAPAPGSPFPVGSFPEIVRVDNFNVSQDSYPDLGRVFKSSFG